MENHSRKTSNQRNGVIMKLFLVVFIVGFLFASVGLTQDKSDKNCCSNAKSKSVGKTCDSPDEVSKSSSDKDKLISSVQVDDKNKKFEKNVKCSDKKLKNEKSTNSSSNDGCCSPNKKKTEKLKANNKS